MHRVKTASADATRPFCLLGATVLLAVALLWHPATGWNVNSRLSLTMAIVDHGEVTIDRYHDVAPTQTDDKAYFEGHYYSDKTIGLSLLAVPAYAGIKFVSVVTGRTFGFATVNWLLTVWAVGVPAALAAMFMALLFVRLGALPSRAVLMTAFVVFGSLMFGYSTVFMPYLPGVAACAGALVMTLGHAFDRRRAAAVGALLGVSVLFDLMFVIVAVAIAVVAARAMWPSGRRAAMRLGAVAMLAVAVPIGVFAAYCIAIFGSPTIPYRYEASQFFRDGMAQGLMGATAPKPGAAYHLLVHPFRGVLFWSPWLAMVAVCWVWIARHAGQLRWLVVMSATVFALYLAYNAGYYLWWGGDAMGPRLLLPMFAVVPLALAVAGRADAPRWMWWGVVATGVTSVALSLPVSMINPQTPVRDATTDLLHPTFSSGFEATQLHLLGHFYRLEWGAAEVAAGGSSALRLFACLVVVVVGVALAWRAARTARCCYLATP